MIWRSALDGPRDRGTRSSAVIAFGVVFALLALPLLFGRFYYGLDLTRADVGMLCALRRHLSTGAPLTVSPLLGNGLPLLAEPSAQLLYPPRWLTLLFPPDLGASLSAIFHLALAAAGTAWLARTWKISRAGALGAGVAFAFSGTALDLMSHSFYVVGAAWLPFAWASIRTALRRDVSAPLPASWSWRDLRIQPAWAVFFLALSFCLLGGEPQSAALATAIGGFEVASAAWRRRRVALLVRFAGVVMASVLVTLPQYASLLREASLGERGNYGAIEATRWWALSPDNWLAILIPGWLEYAFSPGVSFKTLWFGPSASLFLNRAWNQTPYLGVACLVLGLVGFVTVRRALVARVVLLAALVASLGPTTPVLPFLARIVPGLSSLRYPEKYFLVATLVVVLFAAKVLDWASSSRRLRRRVILGCTTALVVVGTWAAIVALKRAEIDAVANLASAGAGAGHGWPSGGTLSEALLDGLIGQALFLMFSVLALGYLGTKWDRSVSPVPLILPLSFLLVAVQHLHAGPPFADLGTRSPIGALTPPPLRSNVVLCHASRLSNRTAFLSREGPGWNELAGAAWLGEPNLGACAGVSAAELYFAVNTRIHRTLIAELRYDHVATARALGCTHMIANGVPNGPAAWVSALTPGAAPQIFRIADPVPDVFGTTGAQWATSEVEVLNRMRQGRSVDDLVAIVDDPVDPQVRALPTGGTIRALKLKWPTRDYAEVSVDGVGGAVVGLATIFLRGWTARQNERSLPVVRVAATQLGALVEDVAQGPIVFEYRSPLGGWAWFVMGVGLALGLLMGGDVRVRASCVRTS